MKKISAFKAIELTKIELNEFVHVEQIDLKHTIDDEMSKRIDLTVFFELNGERNNFSATIYEFDSELTFEELITKAKNICRTLAGVGETEINF